MSDLALGTARFGLTNSGCIHCGEQVDTFSGFGKSDAERENPPKPGDITLCIKCGGLQAINDAGDGFRKTTPSEDALLEKDERVIRLHHAARLAAEHGGAIKSAAVFHPLDKFRGDPDTADAAELASRFHRMCIEFYSKSDGFTEDQILEIAAAGSTLAFAYARQLPYRRRLELVSSFVSKAMTISFGKTDPIG